MRLFRAEFTIKGPTGAGFDGYDFMSRLTVIKRRSAAAVILAFLLITAASAPVVYRMGKAHSAALPEDPSQTGTFGPAVAFSGATTTDCGLLGPSSSIHSSNVIVDCLEQGGHGDEIVVAAAERRPRETKTIFDIPIKPRETPLEKAVMAAVAGQGAGPGGGGGNPLHLAMAPDGSPATAGSIFEGATGWPGGGGGGNGIPPRLIPGGAALQDNGDPPSTTDETPPGGGPRTPLPPINEPEDELPPPFEIPDGTPDPTDPPDLVTPVPGALPLMLTGLLGFLFARRRGPVS